MRVRHPLFYLSGALAVFACLTGCGGGGTPMITIGGGVKYVAVGSGGVIYTSSDAATWSAATSGTAKNLQDVVWNGTVFCAVGVDGTALHSSDGTTWTPAQTVIPTKLNAVATNGSGLLCAVGDAVSGHSVVAFSSDNGVTWTLPTLPASLTQNLNGICWDGGRFTAVGDGGFTTVSITGGSLWEDPIYTTPAEKLLDVTAFPSGSATRLAVGTGRNVFLSTGYSLAWTNPATLDTVGFMPGGIASSGTRAVVSGFVNMGGGRIFTATTAAPGTWTEAWKDTEPNHALSKITWDGTHFIAVGSNGTVVVSSDGSAASWTYHSVPTTTQTLSGIASRN